MVMENRNAPGMWAAVGAAPPSPATTVARSPPAAQAAAAAGSVGAAGEVMGELPGDEQMAGTVAHACIRVCMCFPTRVMQMCACSPPHQHTHTTRTCPAGVSTGQDLEQALATVYFATRNATVPAHYTIVLSCGAEYDCSDRALAVQATAKVRSYQASLLRPGPAHWPPCSTAERAAAGRRLRGSRPPLLGKCVGHVE